MLKSALSKLFKHDEPVRASAMTRLIERAAIINDNDAVMGPETALFYLRGIFGDDEDAVIWGLDLLNTEGALTVAAAEKKIEEAIGELRTWPALGCRIKTAFDQHRKTTAANRRAYLSDGRENPQGIYWPDPTLTDSHPSANRSLYTELPFARRIPLIDKSTPVVSAGSCFATEIAHALQRNGYNYVIKEQNRGKPGSYEFLGRADDLPDSSAAWGIIFNTPSFRQLVEKAFEVRRLPKILWTQEYLGRVRYLDPFRENIGFDSPEAFEANYDEHIRAAREAFLEMEVFIITLGLNEVWYFKSDGAVFSRSPWKTAPSLVAHRVLSVEENVSDLVRMTEILRAHNPKVSIICTLSPIGLHATFRGDEQHVVTANSHSKAVLRVAAEEFTNRCRNVHYFPSYETVTVSTERPWKPDQRHTTHEAIKNVMSLFHKMFEK
jgi:GSCFA family